MADPEISQRIQNLRNQINLHNYRYHTLDDPFISDYEFDQLVIELRSLENKYPELITIDSPTQRAGSKILSKFNKITHPKPILSLANGFGSQDVRDWYERIVKLDDRVSTSDFVVEPKIDGLTVVLHYLDGIFSLGATRGDGEVGEDVTENLRTIPSIPLKIPVQGTSTIPSFLVVRGEVYIAKNDFDELNNRLAEEGLKTYLNPRNTAAGSLRQLDPQITATRPLRILVYSIIAAQGKGSVPDNQWDTLMLLKEFGFPVSNLVRHCKDIDEAIQVCEKAESHKDSWPFEADGTVIKLNNLTLANELGFVGKDPRGAIAYKYPAQEVTTTLKDIVINVGRTGVLTPQAVLDPVEIGGVIVKQATLHNFDYILEKDIRNGDRVLLKRAGEVIPYVIGPIIDARKGDELPWKLPSNCPSCDQPIENIPGEVAWYCVNSACPAQLIRNIEYFVSKGAMDINGLGIQLVKQLIDAGLLKDVADLYSLTKKELLELEGFADKKADNLLDAISQSKNQSLERLIISLGIRGIGEIAARELSKIYPDLDSLSHATMEEIQMLQGFGPNMAKSITNWFDKGKNLTLLNKLREFDVWPLVDQKKLHENANQILAGLSFVITGTLPTLSRSETGDLILENGGKVSSSVSRNTSYLILGADPGSKYDKAVALNIPILNETQFLNMIKGQ
ncbi:MAG: NAD-dependent DNA ligase LigA [Anaerolineaceae bacterium]|nr:NAD-dependent DNA ligase LigA [Anaerolineaceae bacterium]